jgi:hypothetical protein
MKTTPCSDWNTIKTFLPHGWEIQAGMRGALQRRRKIKDAETLLRLLLIHCAEGTSMRTTVAYAREAGLCEINDVALLHRLKASGGWLQWIAQGLAETLRTHEMAGAPRLRYRVRVVDGTVVNEPGATGSDWRIHYVLLLDTLRCDSFVVTRTSEGETLQRHEVRRGDLLVADRLYCSKRNVAHVVDNEGDVVVRYHSTNLSPCDRHGRQWDALKALRTLKTGDVGDWDAWVRHPDNGRLLKGRLCAVRKSDEMIAQSQRKLRRKASKKCYELKEQTQEHAAYVAVFTTVNRHAMSGRAVLSLYQDRWQIELVFKRLKSLVHLSALPKTDAESCVAWLHGKLVLALLAERLYREAEFFSPWGYPLGHTPCKDA